MIRTSISGSSLLKSVRLLATNLAMVQPGTCFTTCILVPVVLALHALTRWDICVSWRRGLALVGVLIGALLVPTPCCRSAVAAQFDVVDRKPTTELIVQSAFESNRNHVSRLTSLPFECSALQRKAHAPNPLSVLASGLWKGARDRQSMRASHRTALAQWLASEAWSISEREAIEATPINKANECN